MHCFYFFYTVKPVYSDTCVICFCVIRHWISKSSFEHFLCIIYSVIRHPVYSNIKFLSQCMSGNTGFTVHFHLPWSLLNFCLIWCQFAEGPRWTPGGQFAPQPLGHSHSSPSPVNNPRQEAARGRMDSMRNSANKNAAAELKAMMVNFLYFQFL